jgi:hypothetical protein
MPTISTLVRITYSRISEPFCAGVRDEVQEKCGMP